MARQTARNRPTRLSSKGQILIPKEIRERHGWVPGVELTLEDRGDSVILRRAEHLPETTLRDLVGCTGYRGPARSLEEMEAAIARKAPLIALDTSPGDLIPASARREST